MRADHRRLTSLGHKTNKPQAAGPRHLEFPGLEEWAPQGICGCIQVAMDAIWTVPWQETLVWPPQGICRGTAQTHVNSRHGGLGGSSPP